jgi:hypothetical protein
MSVIMRSSLEDDFAGTLLHPIAGSVQAACLSNARFSEPNTLSKAVL